MKVPSQKEEHYCIIHIIKQFLSCTKSKCLVYASNGANIS